MANYSRDELRYHVASPPFVAGQYLLGDAVALLNSTGGFFQVPLLPSPVRDLFLYQVTKVGWTIILDACILNNH